MRLIRLVAAIAFLLLGGVVGALNTQPVRLDLGASTEVDAEGVEARLTVKLEYLGCYFYDRGNQSSHLL